MDSLGRKTESVHPIILKAGIPLAVSVGGFIYALMAARRKLHVNGDASEEGTVGGIEDEPQEGVNLSSQPFMEEDDGSNEDHQGMVPLIRLRVQYRTDLEEEISWLKNHISALQNRERNLKMRFLYYCSLKEHELASTRLQHKLVLEQARVEFLDRRIESMQAENRRFQSMVVEYFRILNLLEAERLENGLLRKKAKKLLTKGRKYMSIAHRQASALQAKEREILNNQEELHEKSLKIVELNGEIVALKKLVDQLQEEKKELADKIKLTETSVSCSSEKDSELEQLRKERMAEAEELIYLRWINACFRHELTRNQEPHGKEDEEQHQQTDHIVIYDSDAPSITMDQGESCAFMMTGSHCKPKFLSKLRRWAKGGETGRKSWNGKEHDNEYGRVRSISYGVAEQHAEARNSCSSV